VIYLEASCGHEFSVADGGVAPADTVCPEHGRVSLWAQRGTAKTANPRPLPHDRLSEATVDPTDPLALQESAA
jgi:hypothetical protein